MRKNLIKYTIGALSVAALCFASCKNEDDTALNGEGTLRLSVSASDKIEIVSRSLSDEVQQQLQSNCQIRIFNSEYLVRKYEGVASLPSELTLASGQYRATVYAGDSVAASFDKCFYLGEKEFEIKKGTVSPVNVACGIGNTVVAVALSDELKAGLTTYTVTIASGNDKLEFTPDNIDRKGYFTPPTTNRKLKYTLKGTRLNGTSLMKTGSIMTERATLYNLNFKLNESSTGTGETGGMGKPILTVNATSLKPTEHDFTLTQRVRIAGYDADGIALDLTKATHWTSNSTQTYKFEVSSFGTLKSISISLPTETGLAQTSVDFLSASEEELQACKEKGIEFTKPAQGEDQVWRAYITFGTAFSQALSKLEADVPSKEYQIEINATEAATDEYPDGRQRAATWSISVNDDKIETVANDPASVWTNRATLQGKVTNSTWSQQPKFRYRETGSTEWTTVEATLSGDTFTAEITGLKDNTEYEYQAVDGEQPASNTCKFTTESKFQPQNAGFEKTSGSSPLLFYADGEQMWWDSGNKGSSTLGKNVTQTTTEVKHGGNQSLYMVSQFVGLMGIGKFAAGNIFTGEFMGTENTYYGILGWGRPCTSRPKALRVWVRYTPGTVDYTETDKIAKGDTDQGIVYVAVGDWKSSDSEYGSQWPVVVRTKGPSLFNPKDKGTIGYGEKVFTSNFSMDTNDMTLVEIPLDYDNYGGNNRKPTHIIIVASASRYGDYYSGSTQSRMWLDDMELVYE